MRKVVIGQVDGGGRDFINVTYPDDIGGILTMELPRGFFVENIEDGTLIEVEIVRVVEQPPKVGAYFK
jgi:hypothetical protein